MPIKVERQNLLLQSYRKEHMSWQRALWTKGAHVLTNGLVLAQEGLAASARLDEHHDPILLVNLESSTNTAQSINTIEINAREYLKSEEEQIMKLPSKIFRKMTTFLSWKTVRLICGHRLRGTYIWPPSLEGSYRKTAWQQQRLNRSVPRGTGRTILSSSLNEIQEPSACISAPLVEYTPSKSNSSLKALRRRIGVFFASTTFVRSSDGVLDLNMTKDNRSSPYDCNVLICMIKQRWS